MLCSRIKGGGEKLGGMVRVRGVFADFSGGWNEDEFRTRRRSE